MLNEAARRGKLPGRPPIYTPEEPSAHILQLVYAPEAAIVAVEKLPDAFEEPAGQLEEACDASE